MRRIADKRDRYAYMIDWLIRFGDLILLNIFFYFLHLVYTKYNLIPLLSYDQILETLLLLNLTYIFVSAFVKFNISSNIVYLDKIISKTSYFITLYWILLTVGLSIFKIMVLSVLPWILGYITLTLLFVCWHVLFRLVLKTYRRKGYNFKNTLIVGGGGSGAAIYNLLIGSDYGYKVVGYFDDEMDAKSEAMPPYLGKISEINKYIENNTIDEIYCTLPSSQDETIINLINLSDKRMIRFSLIPEFYKYFKRNFSLRSLGPIPILSLRYEPLEHASNRFIKRLFDLIFSILVIITIFPFVYLIFGIAIKLSSPGPIFFKQKRTGIKGNEFFCYKFRSMKMNDDANQKSAVKEDPRVTKIGQFMRKTSVDELPQFLNVLKGDMSVVGPRPHMLRHTEEYAALIEKFMVRHLVKPGITGWAQVNGYRGETKVLDDMEERVKKDVWYIEHWSFFLDIKVIVITVYNAIRGEEKAY